MGDCRVGRVEWNEEKRLPLNLSGEALLYVARAGSMLTPSTKPLETTRGHTMSLVSSFP